MPPPLPRTSTPVSTRGAAPRRRCRRCPAAAADPPPPPSGTDVDVGLLWKRGGGAEATLEGLTKEEAVVPAPVVNPADPSTWPTMPKAALQPAAAAAGSAHSALKDRKTFNRLHASSVAQGELFFHNLSGGFEWRNKPATGRARAVATKNGYLPTGAFFAGGRLNVAVNCVSRHLDAKGAATAIAWPGGGLPFADADAAAFAQAAWLRRAGVARGDAVAIYLPAGPDLVTALLAAAAIGAAACVLDPAAPTPHAAAALAASGARVAITASGGVLAAGGAAAAVKARFDEVAAAAADAHSHALDSVLCHEAGGVAVADTPWTCSRDVWAAAALPAAGTLAQAQRPASDADTDLVLISVPGHPAFLTAHAASAVVGGAVTARLMLDAQSDAVVAFAGPVGHPASIITCTLGALANGSAVASLPPPSVDGGGEAWWQAAAAARVTHVVATPDAAAALATGGPPPATLQTIVIVTDGPTSSSTAETLAAAVGESVAVLSAWQPAGAGTPVLAAAPHALGLGSPAAMVPWLGCGPPGQGGWKAAWPALATRVVDGGDGTAARAWWQAACANGDAYAPDEAGLTACDGDEGAWRWA